MTAWQPLVSVIIPTYNRAHLIRAAVDSVLAQTYRNLEIIVVDDGSTDTTAAVLGALTDPRLQYVQQPNGGRSQARNHALRHATGELISFLDSDDLYLPQKIEQQVNYLHNHPGVGMVYTSAHCINAAGDIMPGHYIASVSGLIYQSIAFFRPVTITLPTVMTYRAVLDAVGHFDETMHRFEDTDLWRRIAKAYRIDAMPEFTCLLRTHDDNALANQDPAVIIEALDYYAAKIMCDDADIPLPIRRAGLARFYNHYGCAFKSHSSFKLWGDVAFKKSDAYAQSLAYTKSLLRHRFILWRTRHWRVIYHSLPMPLKHLVNRLRNTLYSIVQ